MSVTANILRVDNLRGVVTSLIDRGADAQLLNQYGAGITDEALFDNTLNKYLEESGEKEITAIPLDVVVRYTPEISSTFTSNPVQVGVNVNDHSFNNPDTLTINFGTSDVKGTLARMSGIIRTIHAASSDNFKGTQTPSRLLLSLLYRAKEMRTLFQVDDGLHTYTDMVIQSISYDKDKTTYRALVATIVLQQFIFVGTSDVAGVNGLSRAKVQPLDKSTVAAARKIVEDLRLVV